jgi:L-rhamnose isomerase/sugar isomerase
MVDRIAIDEAQRAGDILGANDIMMDAFYTDVRPILAEWRIGRSLDPDPVAAFAASGYLEKIAKNRVGGKQAGWGA